MDEEPAYRSRLTITFDAGEGPAWPQWQRMSIATDAVDPELAELRRRMIDPVVASVFRDDELDSVVVFEEGTSHEIRATVVARGEASYHYPQATRSLPATEDELTSRAAQFASELETFIAESKFGWGQNRVARYKIPPA